ncbi:MAG: carboxypeptidase regulatory-like domain-containing protein [Verrucomicrobia bacterium]|nr:carboxypeptidase regulatory-like domain-containing protein [Verrucomicrobiota bacterium]
MKPTTKAIVKRVAMVIGACYLIFVAFNCWRLFVLRDRPWQPSAAFSSSPVFKRGMPKEQLEKLWWEAHERDRWFEYKMPIRFYGKVVDENSTPVASVNIRLLCTDLTEKNGVVERQFTSNKDGRFSLEGVRGKSLHVEMTKDGYYTPQHANQYTFEYAQYTEPNFYEPDPDKPVTFVLRRKGIAEPLVHRKLEVKLASDGVPVRGDLLRGKESADGQIEIQMWKSSERDEHGRFNWHAIIRVTDGGILETKDEFPFTAPDRGYGKEVEIKESSNLGKDWKASVKTQYFVRLGDPPRYARIKTHMLGTSRWVFIECWVNPSGSRNLEYDRNKDITQLFK